MPPNLIRTDKFYIKIDRIADKLCPKTVFKTFKAIQKPANAYKARQGKHRKTLN